mgnify:CR=1 FL=1
MNELFDSDPKLWAFRAIKAFEEVNLNAKPIVTVRCMNQGCGKALGYLYPTRRGPIWAPLKRTDKRPDAINRLRVVLIKDQGLPEDWRDDLIGCRQHILGSTTKQQLLDAWDEARHRGRRVSMMLYHPALYGQRPNDAGHAVGRELSDTEIAEIRDNPEVSM